MTSSSNINVMLGIHGKRTVPVDVYRPLRNYIVSHFSEKEAQDAEEDLQAIQQMRSEIEKQADALESRRDLLQRYYRSLSVIESRFPISSERDHVNQLHFVWFDAFKQGKKVSQQNIHFEKAAIIFNLAATQSQLGISADRSTANGLRQACNSFQASAGAFAFLRDNISMKAAGSGNYANSTVDVTVECAGMLERLMLGQAQECFYEKVMADGKPSALCGRVARQVGMYYEEAYAAVILPPLNTHFDRAWVIHVQLKAAQFLAESLYRTSLDLHDQDNIADEIARLKAATAILAEAKRNGRGVVGPLMDSITKLEGNVNRNLERALKENDRVYLMRVPDNESLPPIPGANLVKAFALGDVLDASQEKLFSGLIPDSSAKALSKYTEMVDDIIRAQAEKLLNESDVARVRLKELDLPDVLQALNGSPSLPENLRDDVEAVQVDGGPAGLGAEMAQLKDLRRVNEELLVQAEESLDKEAREDVQIRQQLGTRWTRPQSSTLTKNLRDRATAFAMNLKQAADSDARIERTIKDNESLLSVLNNKPIETALPRLTKPMVSLHGDEEGIVARLRQLLTELEKLGSQRAGLEDMLKDMKHKDNILPRLMNTSGSYEDLFKKELAKYDPICSQVAKNIEAQNQLLQQIRVQGEAFAKAYSVHDYDAARDNVLRQINSAVAKYREIRDNINEGLKFYITLQDAITALKQQCTDYVMTRGIQCREMMSDLQRNIAGLSFQDSQSTSQLYPPSSASPQQQQQPQPQPQPTGPAAILQHIGGFFGQRNQQPQTSSFTPTPPAPSGHAAAPQQVVAPEGQPYYTQAQQQQYQPPGSYYNPAAPHSTVPPQGGYSTYPSQPHVQGQYQSYAPAAQQNGQWPPYYQGAGGAQSSQQHGAAQYPPAYHPPGGY